MAVILVDYENVWAANGLKGVEYLNTNDTLYIFYSQCCGKIRAEYMDAIEKSGCEFKIYKLKNAGKNALDFYIASECGVLIQSGETQIAIISNDKGFSAVSDFFKLKQDAEKIVIATASNIENGLMALNSGEDAVRCKTLKEKSRLLDLAVEQARMQERNLFRHKILSALAGTKYEEMSSQILEFVEGSKGNSPKVFYTSSLHHFGRSDGVAIYQILKNVV